MAGQALIGIRVGTAGWGLPKGVRVGDSAGKTMLELYAMSFNAVEINSSFYRPHRRSTYERWSASVPDSFRFSVKIPKLITHERGLTGCEGDIVAFFNDARGLGEKLATLLVQLPPSRIFEERSATEFFKRLRQETSAHIGCEARNPSWFTAAAALLFDAYGITRVAANPVPRGCEFHSEGQSRFAYFRLHGAPRMYYSAYPASYLKRIAAAARALPEAWCILDNTAAGAAWSDAATLQGLLGAKDAPPD